VIDRAIRVLEEEDHLYAPKDQADKKKGVSQGKSRLTSKRVFLGGKDPYRQFRKGNRGSVSSD